MSREDRPSAQPAGLQDLAGLEVLPETPHGLDMPLTLEQLAEEAMQLPVASRAQLADKLAESLDLSEPDEIQRLWAA